MSRVRMLALLAAAGAMLSACSPTPEPSPTPTAAFASEEEAFAAAEETYRAYTDALNEADVSDSRSLEVVYTWLAGNAESNSRETFSELTAEDLTVSGATKFSSFSGRHADLESGQVEAALCLDVSDVDVVDSSGHSVVSETRPDHQPMNVLFARAATPTGLAIASTQSGGGECTP